MILDAKVPHAISREKLRENGPQATAQSDNLNKTKKEQDQNQNYYSMKAYNLVDHYQERFAMVTFIRTFAK